MKEKAKLTCKHLSGHHVMFTTTKISKLLVMTVHVFQAFHTSFSAIEVLLRKDYSVTIETHYAFKYCNRLILMLAFYYYLIIFSYLFNNILKT